MIRWEIVQRFAVMSLRIVAEFSGKKAKMQIFPTGSRHERRTDQVCLLYVRGPAPARLRVTCWRGMEHIRGVR